MMTGTYVRTVDAKNRLVLPAAFRARFAAPLALAQVRGRRILIAEEGAMEELIRRDRLVAALVWPVSLDAYTHRFQVPYALREALGVRRGQSWWFGGVGLGVVAAGSRAQLVLALWGEE